VPFQKIALDLAEQLAHAKNKIAELESEIARLRTQPSSPVPAAPPAPSFILESITDAFVAVDTEFRYIWVNAEAERLTGKSKEELLGRSIWELFPQCVGSVLDRKCRQALADQTPLRFDNHFQPGDRWFHNKVYPTSEGGLAIYWREVTEQKREKADLRRQALVLQQVHDSIITTDLEGNITCWNHGAEKMFGYQVQEMIGQNAALLYFEEDRHQLNSQILGPLSRDGEVEVELRNRRKSGEECFVRLSVSLLRDEANQPYGILGVAIDITEQRRAEQALRESEERYRCLAHAMPQVVYLTGQDGKTELVNQHWEKYSGIRAEECFGFNWLAWIHPDDVEPLMPLWADCLRTGKSFEAEYRLRNAGGEYRWHLSRAVAVRGVDGAIAQWVGTLTDIHDLKTAQETLRRNEKRLQDKAAQLTRANEDLLHFAYAASHDLQAPMRTVVAFSRLLDLKYKARLDEESGKLLRHIVDAGSRMATMLRDLLQFAELAGGQLPSTEPIPLGRPLATALQNLHSEIKETGARITHDLLPTVAGHPVRLAQLFQNLVGNALKYRKPEHPPRIHISARTIGGESVTTIRDNGIGFEPKYAESIFGIFRRLHGEEVAGTGIGLAICQRIVERLGGRIWAKGELGAGASFSFSLPLADAAVAVDSDSPHFQVDAPRAGAPALATIPRPQESAFDELFHTLDLAQAVVRQPEGTVLIWTTGAERLFGWLKSEAIGRRVDDLLKIVLPKPISEIEAELLRTGKWVGQVKAKRKDGGAVWLASHWSLYRDGSGRPQSVIEVHNDITAFKEAEAALLRSTEQRNLALRAGRMGVWRWDLGTGLVEWDVTLEGLLGMEPESFEGTFDAYFERVHPDDRTVVQERISAASENQDYFVECRIRHMDGNYRWFRGQGQLTYDERRQSTGLIGVVWDISSLKQRGDE